MNKLEHDFTKEEAINQIEQVYQASYGSHLNLTVWEQLEICESLAETEERTNEYAFVKEDDTSKRSVNLELIESKREVIAELKACDYKTPPSEIASLLEKFFDNPETKPGHWLSVAQQWPPRRIFLTINQMLKRQSGGWITIENPAAYFTFLVNKRKKRKLTGVNDTYKK